MTQQPAPRVFISYSHDTVEHQERVLSLADRLRTDGIDAEIDQYNAAPPKGWPLWCEQQIEAADFVLMICTETYYRRVSGDEERGGSIEELRPGGKALGVVWEARIIRQLLYDAGAVRSKFVPALFSDASPEQIPTPIKGWTRYVVDTSDGYEELYRRLTGQPRLPRPTLGKIRALPARPRQWPEAGVEAATPPSGKRPDVFDSVPNWPDDPLLQPDQDLLGRAAFASYLAERIAAVPPDSGAYSMHIYGPWGAGKSSLLNFLRRELERRKDRKKKWLVVEFNAWRQRHCCIGGCEG